MKPKLLTQVGFTKDDNKPFIRYADGNEIILRKLNFGENYSFKFTTDERHCIGWFNPNTGENHTCPLHAKVDAKYEQCKECMKKTGFNPSFYNTSELSENQAEYNTHPHILYLAYFSANDIKVGISHAGRNLSRLLEQGARLAYILETFPSANVARHYEAMISHLDGIVDNVKLSRKLELINENFDPSEAQATLSQKKAWIEAQIQSQFNNAKLIDNTNYFFASDFDQTRLREVVNLADQSQISGKLVGMLGQIMLCEKEDNILALPLKKLTGYYFDETADLVTIDVPPAQFSLF